MREGLAFLAAALGAVAALAPLRLLGNDELLTYSDQEVAGGLIVAFAVLTMAVPTVVAAAFAVGGVGQRWAAAAAALFVVATMLAGWTVFYLGHIAAFVLGWAIAAGEPLPPPEPGDDRLTRPMPRPDDYR